MSKDDYQLRLKDFIPIKGVADYSFRTEVEEFSWGQDSRVSNRLRGLWLYNASLIVPLVVIGGVLGLEKLIK